MTAASKLFGSLWALWIAFFCITEAFGVPRHQSLSEWCWWATKHPVLRFPFAAFIIWLFLHLILKLRA